MNDQIYLNRCLDLAKLGLGSVSPNPLVGACLVHKDRIIGEGFHRELGKAHAEINAIKAVSAEDEHLIKDSTLYVSLEPCHTHGRTPPCTDRILEMKIPRVVIGSTDPNPNVNGKGAAKLREAGLEVIMNEDESDFVELNRAFWINQLEQRTYMVGKIAKSRDGFIGKRGERIWLSNSLSTLESHRLRAASDAIIVGVNTVVNDDPQLTTRHVNGPNPIRIIPDLINQIDPRAKVFDEQAGTLYFTQKRRLGMPDHVEQVIWEEEFVNPTKLCKYLYERGIGIAILEGGSALMRSFYHDGCLDEFLEIITRHYVRDGVPAPLMRMNLINSREVKGDRHNHYYSDKISQMVGHIR